LKGRRTHRPFPPDKAALDLDVTAAVCDRNLEHDQLAIAHFMGGFCGGQRYTWAKACNLPGHRRFIATSADGDYAQGQRDPFHAVNLP
jgi:hypothetical protein